MRNFAFTNLAFCKSEIERDRNDADPPFRHTDGAEDGATSAGPLTSMQQLLQPAKSNGCGRTGDAPQSLHPH